MRQLPDSDGKASHPNTVLKYAGIPIVFNSNIGAGNADVIAAGKQVPTFMAPGIIFPFDYTDKFISLPYFLWPLIFCKPLAPLYKILFDLAGENRSRKGF